MEIKDRIKQERNRLKITQQQLAFDTGLSIDSIRSIESGRAKPSIETLSKLSDRFGCTVDYLIGKENRGLPFISEVTGLAQVGVIKSLNDESSDSDSDEIVWVNPELLQGRKSVAYKVLDSAMVEDDIRSGDIVIATSTNNDEINGDEIYLIFLDNNFFVRRLSVDDKSIRLIPSFRKYDEIVSPRGEVFVLGKVVHVIKNEKSRINTWQDFKRKYKELADLARIIDPERGDSLQKALDELPDSEDPIINTPKLEANIMLTPWADEIRKSLVSIIEMLQKKKDEEESKLP